MTRIIIPAIPSQGFQNRSLALWNCTLNWLATELLFTDMPGGVQVEVWGKLENIPPRIPDSWRHYRTSAATEEAVAIEADSVSVPGDILVMVSLATPLRERGLLEKVLEAARHTGMPVGTVANQHRDNWREVDQEGKYCNIPVDEAPRTVWDGQVLAWPASRGHEAVDPQAPHVMVHTNHVWATVNAGIPADLPPGLTAMAGEMLLASVGSRPIPKLEGKKVLLIGSGKDLNGRCMRHIIDNSDTYDYVVRCNKYYGDPDDVGTRTDIAVIRWENWAHEFFKDGPGYPKSWITINDGKGIPLALLAELEKSVGHPNVSCGIIAAEWLVRCGATVSVIGMGRSADGKWPENSVKTYPDGTVDNNPHYDWAKENAWWDANESVIML